VLKVKSSTGLEEIGFCGQTPEALFSEKILDDALIPFLMI
jgi:hypothetical protein